jgi:glycosyltransferase involved in cell wall biosynthesis
LNVLLINYGPADNNSAYHILGHAAALATRGHAVCVGVVKGTPEGFEARDGFRLTSHRALLKHGARFPNGLQADVLHIWTPREIVRSFTEAYQAAWGASAWLVHLEDPEETVFERFTGFSQDAARRQPQDWPKGLIHPDRYRAFLESAAGITIVHECLRPLVPAGLPWLELVPELDAAFFSSTEDPASLRSQLGVDPGSRIVVFNGNDHAATAGDTRRLYEAVDQLIGRGRDIVLVRTGQVIPDNYSGLSFRPGKRCIELGFLERRHIPALMDLASVAIQPGDADAFNRHRLPAKVPEYLLLGKPLIMGSGNLGPELAAHQAAVVLPEMTAAAMAAAVEHLLDHPDETTAMAERGRTFARTRFTEGGTVAALEAFYRQTLDAQRV